METEIVTLPAVQSSKYMGSPIDRGGGASKDVESRVAKACSKWREPSGVICDKTIPTQLKLLIYQTVIRPTLLYGCETWPMSVTELPSFPILRDISRFLENIVIGPLLPLNNRSLIPVRCRAHALPETELEHCRISTCSILV